MRKRFVLLLMLWATALAGADEPAPEDFAFGMALEISGEAAAYRLSLPEEVYRTAVREDLGDVRVFNGHGAVVPHTIRRAATAANVEREPQRLPVFTLRGDRGESLDAFRVVIESGRAAVDVRAPGGSATTAEAVTGYIVDARQLDMPIAALQIEWPAGAADFAGQLGVSVSNDLVSWRALAPSAPIANLRAGGEQLIERRIEVAATSAKFWRLSWVGRAAPFPITGVWAEPADDYVEVDRSTLEVPGVPAEGETHAVEFDLQAHLPVDRLNLSLPELNSVVAVELFSRAQLDDPWRPVVQHGFYRLRNAGGELRNGPVAISPNAHRYWLAKTNEAGGGFGSGVPKLTVGWVAHETLFLARGAGPFTLAYGSGLVQPAQATLGTIPANTAIHAARTGEPRPLGGPSRLTVPARPFAWKSVLLWTALVVGVAVLGAMAWKLARQLR